MMEWLSKFIDRASDFLATRKGLIPVIGIFFIIANFIIQFIFRGWFIDSNLLLHIGLIIAIFGLMLAWAL